MSSKAKTRYLAETSLYAFARRNPVFYFWSNSFRGDGIHDKTEAERRAKPLKDWLSRQVVGGRPAEALFFWEQHPGGHGWHLHWVTNKYIDVNWFRPWMVDRGWGQQMKVKLVTANRARFNGDTWSCDEGHIRAVVLYLVKYVTKDIFDSGGVRKKVWSCTRACKCGTVRFAWVPWINPLSYLWYYGRQAWSSVSSRSPKLENFNLIYRLGLQVTGWGEIDPWCEVMLPGVIARG